MNADSVMKSPFPGMDPFIEAFDLWGDFHDKLIGDLERELSERVPQRYVVRLNARSYITVDDKEQVEFSMLPDIGVKRRKGRKAKHKSQSPRSSPGATLMLENPVAMLSPLEVEQRERFIEIYDIRSERHLVTGIEVLSPSNKRYGSAGWDEYGRSRRAFLNGAANFVEIDLLRGGRRMPMREPWPESPYYVLVSRKDEVPRCHVWPAHSLQALPRIPIPLEKEDADVEIDLQPMVDAIYERARYAVDINYTSSGSVALLKGELERLTETSRRTGRKTNR